MKTKNKKTYISKNYEVRGRLWAVFDKIFFVCYNLN